MVLKIHFSKSKKPDDLPEVPGPHWPDHTTSPVDAAKLRKQAPSSSVYLANQALTCTTNSNQCLTVPLKLFCSPQAECKFQKIYPAYHWIPGNWHIHI